MNLKKFFSQHNRLLMIIGLIIFGMFLAIKSCQYGVGPEPLGAVVPLAFLSLVILLISLILFFQQIGLLFLCISAFLAKLTLWATVPLMAYLPPQIDNTLRALIVLGIVTIFEAATIWVIFRTNNKDKQLDKIILCVLLANAFFGSLITFSDKLGFCELIKIKA